MCGHAVIAIGKLAVEMGWVEVSEPETLIRVDAPCGQITLWVQVTNGQVDQVKFRGVPSFVVALDRTIELPQIGEGSPMTSPMEGHFMLMYKLNHWGFSSLPNIIVH